MSSTYIATTSFNIETYSQYKHYKKKTNIEGCLYGTPIKIKDSIPLDSYIYIIEMNNSTNKIVGIGLIKNKNLLSKYYRIYENQDYNRYTYRGKYWIDTSTITDIYFQKVINVLETLLFKGATHLKRGQGITELPKWILYNKSNFNFVDCMNKLFEKYK
jgi:hypothetical protein